LKKKSEAIVGRLFQSVEEVVKVMLKDGATFACAGSWWHFSGLSTVLLDYFSMKNQLISK